MIEHIKRIHIPIPILLNLRQFPLLPRTPDHLLILLLLLSQHLLHIIHDPIQYFPTLRTFRIGIQNCIDAFTAEDVLAGHLDRALKDEVARFAGLLGFVLVEVFYVIGLLVCIRVHDPLPSLSLPLLIVLLHFPASLIIAPIMQIDTAVAEHAVTTVMPVLTQTRIVIKSTGIFSTLLLSSPRRAMFPFIVL